MGKCNQALSERRDDASAGLGRLFAEIERSVTPGADSAAMLFRLAERRGRGRRAVPSQQLDFRPIDLSRHGALAIEFRRDSYVCSFGSDEIFVAENGADGRGYIDWLRVRLQQFPEGHVHA